MTNFPGQMPPILFEDPHLVVVLKPVGLLSQSDISGDASLVDLLRVYFGRHYVGLVHRLDRDTSGLMVVAKRSKAAQRLTEALQTGKLERNYLAWAHGEVVLSKTSTRLTHWLIKDEKTNYVKAYKEEEKGSKRAELFFRGLQYGKLENKIVTLCSFQLETGRSHQIRTQIAAIGHPLVGDKKYGSRDLVPYPLLHSYQIRFPHPISKELLFFETPAPAMWAKWISS